MHASECFHYEQIRQASFFPMGVCQLNAICQCFLSCLPKWGLFLCRYLHTSASHLCCHLNAMPHTHIPTYHLYKHIVGVSALCLTVWITTWLAALHASAAHFLSVSWIGEMVSMHGWRHLNDETLHLMTDTGFLILVSVYHWTVAKLISHKYNCTKSSNRHQS